MTNSVEIPSGTPLILEWRLFAKELLQILEWLSLEWTKISDITSDVVWKLLNNDRSFFRKFSNAQEASKHWEIIVRSKNWLLVGIEWKWVNAKLEMTDIQ